MNCSSNRVLFPEAYPCGRGVCADFGNCLCEQGWTSKGDFAFSSSGNCNINILATQILWSFVVFANTIELPFILYYVRKKFSTRANPKQLSSTLLLGVLILVSNILLISTGLLRIIFFDNTIGNEPVVTVLFSLGSMVYWYGGITVVTCFLWYLHGIVLKFNSASHGIDFKSFNLMILPSMILVTISCLSPIAMLFPSSFSEASFLIYGGIHYVGIGVLILWFGVFAISKNAEQIEHEFLIVKNFPNQPESMIAVLEQMIIRIHFFRVEFKKQIVPQFILAIFFG